MDIQRCNLDHVLANDRILYNTNNHYSKEGVDMPANYHWKIDQGMTKNWIDKFHKNYCTITLDQDDLKWMSKAQEIGKITEKFSHLYDEELEETLQKYSFPPGKWFIRTEHASLKYSMYGIGPYYDLKSVIKSIVTSSPGHDCFHKEDKECIIYFLPWIDMDKDKEFRIFVYQNRITAISAQHLYTINNWLNTLDDDQIKIIVDKILEYFDAHIKENMSYMSDYVMDLALIGENNTPYFIEPNSFGKYYASGSALFQWELDHDILHDHNTINFRYTDRY